MMDERQAWQVFIWEGEDPGTAAIDGRDPGLLRYVGRIVKPEDQHSDYWKPGPQEVGERFGEGRFFLYDDEGIVTWTKPDDYNREDPVFLDVTAETKYKAREQLL